MCQIESIDVDLDDLLFDWFDFLEVTTVSVYGHLQELYGVVKVAFPQEILSTILKKLRMLLPMQIFNHLLDFVVLPDQLVILDSLFILLHLLAI